MEERFSRLETQDIEPYSVVESNLIRDSCWIAHNVIVQFHILCLSNVELCCAGNMDTGPNLFAARLSSQISGRFG